MQVARLNAEIDSKEAARREIEVRTQKVEENIGELEAALATQYEVTKELEAALASQQESSDAAHAEKDKIIEELTDKISKLSSVLAVSEGRCAHLDAILHEHREITAHEAWALQTEHEAAMAQAKYEVGKMGAAALEARQKRHRHGCGLLVRCAGSTARRALQQCTTTWRS